MHARTSSPLSARESPTLPLFVVKGGEARQDPGGFAYFGDSLTSRRASPCAPFRGLIFSPCFCYDDTTVFFFFFCSYSVTDPPFIVSHALYDTAGGRQTSLPALPPRHYRQPRYFKR